jgi:thioredoxin 1
MIHNFKKGIDMKSLNILSFVIGASISLTSCAPAKVTDAATETKSTSTKKWSGTVVSFGQFARDYKSPQEALDGALKEYNNVIIDFCASWCGPCRNMAPNFKSAAQQFTNTLFLKLDIEEFPSIMKQYGIKSLPTLLYFKNGNIIKRHSGFLSERALKMQISQLY